MNKIAIIGFGNHVIKNILPAIQRMKDIEVESIYVRDPIKYQKQVSEYTFTVKSIKENTSNDVSWVYISTPISTHYNLVEKYLKQGKNVICEKPLSVGAEKTKKLFKLAANKNLRLHEVCMYKYHKQFVHLKNTIYENKDMLKCVSTKFTIPHLGKDDIRYKKDLAGGSLLDVGYYPVSLIILSFGNPTSLKFIKIGADGYEVDLSGVAIFEYDNFYAVAEWGIGFPYANEVTVTTETKIIKYDRIFSKPETYSTKVQIKEGFDLSEVEIGTDDHFVNMFKTILSGCTDNCIDDSSSVIALSAVLGKISESVISGISR